MSGALVRRTRSDRACPECGGSDRRDNVCP